MKSIKNQYIALKEGKMTEAQFMRNVRMTLPEYISNVTLFKQAERILINKGIISEIKINEVSEKSLKEDQDKKYQISKAGPKSTPYYVLIKPDGSEQIDMMFDTPEDAKKYAAKKELSIIKEAKDTSLTGYFNQDGKEQYGKFDELDNMNAQEIMAGYVMEKQDNPDIDKKEAIKLVIKNLKKDPFYYTNYKLTGIRDLQPVEFTSSKRKSGFDDMEEVDKNGNNFVDVKNKMQIVKEVKIEDIKALLSDETLKKSDIGDTNGGVSIIYNDYKELPYKDEEAISSKYSVDKDRLSDKGEIGIYQYYISDKMNEMVKPDAKSKLKELVRKMMKEMFDGRDNLTDIE